MLEPRASWALCVVPGVGLDMGMEDGTVPCGPRSLSQTGTGQGGLGLPQAGAGVPDGLVSSVLPWLRLSQDIDVSERPGGTQGPVVVMQ